MDSRSVVHIHVQMYSLGQLNGFSSLDAVHTLLYTLTPSHMEGSCHTQNVKTTHMHGTPNTTGECVPRYVAVQFSEEGSVEEGSVDPYANYSVQQFRMPQNCTQPLCNTMRALHTYPVSITVVLFSDPYDGSLAEILHKANLRLQ